MSTNIIPPTPEQPLLHAFTTSPPSSPPLLPSTSTNPVPIPSSSRLQPHHSLPPPISTSPTPSTTSSGSPTTSTATSASDIPPCSPRKHKSGMLRTRARSHFPVSKSSGDLVSEGWEAGPSRGGLGLGVTGESARKDGEEEEEDDVEEELEEGNYDNAARFYFAHPFSKSASTSPTRPFKGFPFTHFSSKDRQNTLQQSSTHGSRAVSAPFAPLGNLLARRNFSVPVDERDLTGVSGVISPNSGHLELSVPDDLGQQGRLVILTPTTQEWRELGLEDLKELGGEGQTSESGSDGSRRAIVGTPTVGASGEGEGSGSGSGSGNRSSWGSDKSGGVTPLGGRDGKRRSRLGTGDVIEGMTGTASRGDHAELEDSSLRQVVSPPWGSGSNSTSMPISGASSRDSRRSAPPGSLKESDLRARLEAVQRQEDDRPVAADGYFDVPRVLKTTTPGHSVTRSESLSSPNDLFNKQPIAMSRSQSMSESSDGSAPKKEKERERLFRVVGEEVERHGLERGGSSWNVKQIGNGLGLGELPPRRPGLGVSESAPVLSGFKSQGLGLESGLPSSGVHGLTGNGHAHALTLPSKPPGEFQAVASPLSNRIETESESPVALSPTPMSPRPSNQTELVPKASPSRSRKPTGRTYSRSATVNHNILETKMKSDAEGEGLTAAAPITSRRRQSQRLSQLAGRTPQPFAFPAALPPSGPGMYKKPTSGLSAFSPFVQHNPSPPKSNATPSPTRKPLTLSNYAQPAGLGLPPHLRNTRQDSTISLAPSTTAPTDLGTPEGETAGGLGGMGIEDYVIESEAGKGAYGLVKRARLKGPDGLPVGEEVIIKYIIKSRILADCWKKHKILGPIPIEIHVMDQIRSVVHQPPANIHPWAPERTSTPISDEKPSDPNPPASAPSFPSPSLEGGWQPRISAETVKYRGHPNVCKMLDFFEDREFYYLVMPCFGLGLDLFDRVENAPDGLSPFDIRSLLGQLSDALCFLHHNGIVHRDIKDENVILDGMGHAQLIDFGSAAHWRPTRKWDTFSGTLDYASPEILRGEMYSGKEQDVWALGVVGYVLICGETPFLSADEAQEGLADPKSRASQGLVPRCEGEAGEEGLETDGGGCMRDARDFVERCLEMQLKDRPPAEVLLKHRFLVGAGGWTGFRGWETET